MKKDLIKKAKNYIGYIFTSVIILVLFSYLFVGIGLNFNLSTDFWTMFLIGFAIMVAITTIWYPIAKQKEEQQNSQYKKQRLEYSLLVNRVTETNNFKGLTKFCEYASERNKVDILKQKLAKDNIDYDMFLKYSKDIQALEEEKNLDEKQKKILKHTILRGLSHRFLFWKSSGYEKINHNKITTGIDDVKATYDVTNDEKKFDKRVMFAKVLTSILCSFGFAMIVITGKGFDLGKLAQILTWLGLILWNVFSAINNGKKSVAVHKTNFFKKLRTFLEEFCGSEYYDNTITWTRPKVKEEVNENQEV